MKFGKRLQELLYPEWAAHYLTYKLLKQILKQQISGRELVAAAEGAFLQALLDSLTRVRRRT